MTARHIKFVIAGFDLDTGEEYELAALVTITDEVTYTGRSIDRSQVEWIRRPATEAPFFVQMMEVVHQVCYPERETA